jgi:hypothetical protein
VTDIGPTPGFPEFLFRDSQKRSVFESEFGDAKRRILSSAVVSSISTSAPMRQIG